MSDAGMFHRLTSYYVIGQKPMHPDLNELLNTLVSVAQMLLTKQGEFLPIGAIMLSNGEIRHVGAKIEGNDYPGSQPLIDLLVENFQKEAAKGKLRAAGICYDVLTVPPGKDRKQDAICCGLEHCLVKLSMCLRLTLGQWTAISRMAKSSLRNGRPSCPAIYPAVNHDCRKQMG